jgi:hypothetical protein
MKETIPDWHNYYILIPQNYYKPRELPKEKGVIY